MNFSTWFEDVAGFGPHSWQRELGEAERFESRLVRIPTGMGKTLGVLAAWSFHRLIRQDAAWPRRLVWCLPMRTLVEQTADVARDWLSRMADEPRTAAHPNFEVPVHVLMGGVPAERWHLEPESEAVLIGTQDMLLSRALNRGYGSPRGRWPMEFALLHKDCLWVLDEIQLMDVGLTTSVQLQAARECERTRGARTPPPAHSWWMSATLQPEWLQTRDFKEQARCLDRQMLGVGSADAEIGVIAVPKPVRVERIAASHDSDCRAWAKMVALAHRSHRGEAFGRVTLAIANTVDDARALYLALEEEISREEDRTELRLVHSRFRPRERQGWKAFLSRDACTAHADRIIVSTQVVEAGVDFTASALVTQLAPWPSLVQRFGRAGRYGESTRITVVDRVLQGKEALPYSEQELQVALSAIERCTDVSPAAIDRMEGQLRRSRDHLLTDLYLHDRLHELALSEFDELFDTGPDLTGLDIDVSRFIRSGDERDLLVWWWPCDDGDPGPDLQPADSALCAVPAHRARKWLMRNGRLKDGCRAWVWDYLDGRWRRAVETDLYPGRTVLVDRSWGGYEPELGWTGDTARKGQPPIDTNATLAAPDVELLADLAQDNESLSESPWKTIATHGAEVAEEAIALARELAVAKDLEGILDLAARLHDYGKSHRAFQDAMERDRRPESLARRNDLAKAPGGAWRRGRRIFGDHRGLRHELASTLGLFELLRLAEPWHPALLGAVRAYVDAGVLSPAPMRTNAQSCELQSELASLDAMAFDLVAYLVCAHHGKIRMGWQSTPDDQERVVQDGAMPLRGVFEGDELPPIEVAVRSASRASLPAVKLHLDPAMMGLSPLYGASWRERTTHLREHIGSLELGYLELLLRTADVRASKRDTIDPLIEVPPE